MAKLSKKEIADMCGKPTKWLSVYIQRKKVVVGKDGSIDTENETNMAFLQAYSVNGGADGKTVDLLPTIQKQINAPVVPAKATKTAKLDSDDENADENGQGLLNMDEIMPLHISERIIKHREAEKKQEEITKLQLDNQKKRGEVIPVEPIEPLMYKLKQHLLTADKITDEAFLMEISHKYKISGEDMAYYRGYFIKKRNDAMKEGTENFLRELEATLNEFAIKKGVGERE